MNTAIEQEDEGMHSSGSDGDDTHAGNATMDERKQVKKKKKEDEGEEGEAEDNDQEVVPLGEGMSDEQLEILEQKVAAHVFSYEHHVQLINEYRKRKQFEKRRQACQTMLTYFALSEDMWVAWLNDEIAHCAKDKPEQQQAIVRQFQTALEDNCMPLVRSLYCDFITSTQSNVLQVRNAFEQAVTSSLGLNMKWSHELWDQYRDFEQNLPLDDLLVSQTCRQLFARQFSHPHLDVEETWRKYDEWEELDQERQLMRQRYTECKQQLQSRKPFEMQVKKEPRAGQIPSDKLINVWAQYLEFEKQQGDPVRLLALYERVVKECSLVDRFWLGYVDALEAQQATPEKILSVCRRACRNVTWNGTIWSLYLLQAERCNATKELIDNEIYGRAWQMGLRAADDYQSLFLSYCGYLRRLMDAHQERTELPSALATALEQAVQYMSQYFPHHDTHCTLERFWAHIEAFRFGDVVRARTVYKSYIIERFGSTHLHIWNYVVQFEQLLGADTPALRQVYETGVNQLSQSAQVKHLGLEWVQFERERGDLQTLQLAMLQFNRRYKLLQQQEEEKKAKKKQTIGFNNKSDNTVGEHANHTKEQQQQKKKAAVKVGKEEEKKKKTTMKKEEGKQKKKEQVDNNTKKRKLESNEKGIKKKKKTSEEMKIDEPQPQPIAQVLPNQSPQPQQQSPQPQPSVPQSLPETPQEGGEQKPQPVQKAGVSKYKPILRGPGNENLTLFAWSLPFRIDEYVLRKLFEDAQCLVEDVRVIRNFKGISKGYAYVEMKDQDSIDKGLTLNGTELDGRKINVNPSRRKEELTSEKKEKADKTGDAETKKAKQQQPKPAQQAPKTKPRLLKPRIVTTTKQEPAQQPTPPQQPSSSTTQQPLSNADFKNFFKKQQ